MILAVPVIDNSRYLIITVVAIVIGLIISGFIESKILTRLGWTTTDKAVGFVASTNMITPVIAFIFLAIVFGLFIAFGVKDFTNFQEQGTLKAAIYMIYPVLIIILRQQLLSGLKIRNDIWSWVYAFASTKITLWFVLISIVVAYQLAK